MITTGRATSGSITKPVGVTPGEVLLLVCGTEDSGPTTSYQTKTGWTRHYQVGSEDPDCYIAMYSRVADGTEPANETVSWVASNYSGMWYLRVTGANTTNPIHVVGVGSIPSHAATGTALSVTTTIDDCLVFAHMSYDGSDSGIAINSGVGWPSSVPAGQSLFNPVTADSNGWLGAWLTRSLPAAGPSNNVVFGFSPSDGSSTVQFAVAPGGGGLPARPAITRSMSALLTQ